MLSAPMLPATALLLLLAGTEPSGLRVEAGMFAALPTALGAGQLLGPSFTASWIEAGWSLGGRSRFGQVEESDPTWRVEHTELRLSALAERVFTLGRGELGLGLSVEGFVIKESRTRHQAARLESASFDAADGRLGAGGALSVELLVRLFLYDRWALGVRGGPRASLARVRDTPLLHPGWAAELSIGYAVDTGAW